MTTFFAPEAPVAGSPLTLGADVAHHARVRRLDTGAMVRLSDGAGTVGEGTIVRMTKQAVVIDVTHASTVEAPPPVHLVVPLADRERMLWLAEKATEIGLTSWRPLLWKRSRSVSPRGEGSMFQAKVRARMISALEQSGGAWLPVLYPDATIERAIASAPAGRRLLLDADGEPILESSLLGSSLPGSSLDGTSLPGSSLDGSLLDGTITIAVGPEGGVEPEERGLLIEAGWTPVSLGNTVLRFETAGVAALAIARAALHRTIARAALHRTIARTALHRTVHDSTEES